MASPTVPQLLHDLTLSGCLHCAQDVACLVTSWAFPRAPITATLRWVRQARHRTTQHGHPRFGVNPLNRDNMQEVYDPSREHCQSFVAHSDSRYKKMAAMIPATPEIKVFDVGCFDGSFLLHYVKKSSCVKMGCDLSLPALKEARREQCHVHVAHLEQGFCLLDNSVDVVVAGEIIEHLIDTDLFLEEIGRVLKPGGKLILTTPNVNSLARRLLTVIGANAFFEASPTFPAWVAGHVRFFSFGLLRSFLEARGFRVEQMQSDTIVISASGMSLPQWCVSLLPQLGRSIIVSAIRI